MPQYTYAAQAVMEEVKKAVIGKDDCIRKVMGAILAGGHILIEDIPGVGKTTLALAFSKSMGMAQNRVQFTPDVLPADIVGFSIYDKETGGFSYQTGAVMCNLLLADEINRTSPKTQSALLEAMEEGRVTVDQVTRELPEPFVVIATQNPVGTAGTQMLPESQLDRFFICITMGYPDMEQELAIVRERQSGNVLDKIEPIISAEQLSVMKKEVEDIYIHDAVYNYIGALVTETRNHPMIQLGLSPRGTIALAKMAKSMAYLDGRDYCTPKDVGDVFQEVSCHRIVLGAKARVAKLTPKDVLNDICGRVQAPSPRHVRV